MKWSQISQKNKFNPFCQYIDTIYQELRNKNTDSDQSLISQKNKFNPLCQ